MKKRFAIITAICALAALIFCSAEVTSSVRYALKLCAELILPSLFPFFVISVLLNKLGLPELLGRIFAPFARFLFGVSGAGMSAFFVGLTGGYPLGAAYIADMHQSGTVDTDEAERLMGFCNNSGPAFIIGAVGAGVFGSAAIGVRLYLIHIAAAAAAGIILREKPQDCAQRLPERHTAPGLSQALPDAVKQAVMSALNVCGFIVCFTVLVGLLDADGFFSVLTGHLSSLTGMELHWSRTLLTGIFELGTGVGSMRALSASPANLALAAGLLGWGGISVHYQTMAVLSDTEIKGTLHFTGRLISAVVSAALAYFFCLK